MNVPMKKATPAISFVAKSGTGKTTLVIEVIAELKRRGYRVGAIKHDAHKFEIDHQGKDSYRMTAAGADTTLISSPAKHAVVVQHQVAPPIEELIERHFAHVDLVLAEGYKLTALPKIEVHRPAHSAQLICRGERHDNSLLAVATDIPIEVDVPCIDLNDPSAVADFILAALKIDPSSETVSTDNDNGNVNDIAVAAHA